MMHDDHHEPPLERRPAAGFGRDEYYAEARRSLERHKAECAARERAQRRRGGLTIAEAKRRATRHWLGSGVGARIERRDE
jgi:hypothetical protein